MGSNEVIDYISKNKSIFFVKLVVIEQVILLSIFNLLHIILYLIKKDFIRFGVVAAFNSVLLLIVLSGYMILLVISPALSVAIAICILYLALKDGLRNKNTFANQTYSA